jgi:hypothetical protein
MANSLRAKLSKLRHDGHITDNEYQAFLKKIDGHDREIYNKAIDDFLTHCKGNRNGEGDCFTCVFSFWKNDEWECCYLEKLKK